MEVRGNPSCRLVVFLCLVTGAGGCAFAGDRLLDLTDVVDLKYGVTSGSELAGLGLGVKVRATEVLGVHFAWGPAYETTEWYGRRKLCRNAAPWTLLVIGAENLDPVWDLYYLVLRQVHEWPQAASLFKVGGEIILPFVRGGLFVNLGELADFLLGFTTLDIAEDDGLGKGAPLGSRAGAEEPEPADGKPRPDARDGRR